MSWFPGGRWSPIRQGISAGIGDTAAGGGVSDQIRRLMQSTPTVKPNSATESPPETAKYWSDSAPVPSGGQVVFYVPMSAFEGCRIIVIDLRVAGSPSDGVGTVGWDTWRNFVIDGGLGGLEWSIPGPAARSTPQGTVPFQLSLPGGTAYAAAFGV